MSGTECVQVMVRVRPLNSKEQSDQRTAIVTMDKPQRQVVLRNPRNPADEPKSFTFDAVFDTASSQREVFELVAQPIIDSAMAGYNGTIFAYGQTGTGKTHTMEGAPTADLRGIIPRSFDHIFKQINDSSQTRYLVRASFLEIYNEQIRDLLSPSAGIKTGTLRGLTLRETKDRGVYVDDLRAEVVQSVSAMQALLQQGNRVRSTGATAMNQDSSRSHSIFTITIECTGEVTQDHIRVGKLNLVDLAGSERQAKTGATGERLKEANNINLSLSALGNVISALVDGRSGHIPYRDSKLTRLLQDSLGGNTKTVMIANLGPADWNYDETLSTLRYANRAKNIKNKPRINEDPKDAQLREYQEEIERLQRALERGGGADLDFMDGSDQVVYKQKSLTEEDVQALRAEIEASLKRETSMNGAELSPDELKRIEEEARVKADAERQRLEAEAKAAAAEAETLRKTAEQQRGEVQRTQAEAARIKQERQDMLKKLKMYESKILESENKGGKSLIEKAQEREARLKRQQQELERRRAGEARMAKEIAQKEESALMKEQQYATLDQEIKVKKTNLKKLMKKYQEVNKEVEDMYEEWQVDKEHYMEQMRVLGQQMRLKNLVIDLFVPLEEAHKVMRRAVWDEERELWFLDAVKEAKKEPTVRRPVSASGLRRPTTDFTKTATAMGDLNPRFRSENILSLELDLPERTTLDYAQSAGDVQEALNLAFADEGDVMFVGDDAFQNVFVEKGAEGQSKSSGERKSSRQSRTPSGRTRPSSARRKAEVG